MSAMLVALMIVSAFAAGWFLQKSREHARMAASFRYMAVLSRGRDLHPNAQVYSAREVCDAFGTESPVRRDA